MLRTCAVNPMEPDATCFQQSSYQVQTRKTDMSLKEACEMHCFSHKLKECAYSTNCCDLTVRSLVTYLCGHSPPPHHHFCRAGGRTTARSGGRQVSLSHRLCDTLRSFPSFPDVGLESVGRPSAPSSNESRVMIGCP